jgi:ABC-type sulfate/molybdate transport systems ATPase subunit
LLVCRFRKRLPEFDLDIGLEVGVETLALVGRSGSGKSTMLNTIAGLTQPDAGAIEFAGRMLFDSDANVNVGPEHRRIGLLFQHFALFPHLDVAENVGFGLFRAPRSEREASVRSALEFVGLQGMGRVRPSELSGGERQRVALARALVTQPDALLLDEPLAALDAQSRSRIRLELQALLKRLAIPTVIVTHDYDDARVLGDRIAVLDRGKIVQVGTAGDLRASPADDFVAALTGTNVAVVSHNGGASKRVAFDPWSARISASPSGSAYEWRGEIADVRPFGAHVRFALRGDANITVDLDAADASIAGYRVGDVVFASVPESATRLTR